MRTSVDLLLVTVPVPRRGFLRKLAATVLAWVENAAEAAVRTFRGSRRRPWRQDLPWNVGMDHLADQANPAWIPRGW